MVLGSKYYTVKLTYCKKSVVSRNPVYVKTTEDETWLVKTTEDETFSLLVRYRLSSPSTGFR